MTFRSFLRVLRSATLKVFVFWVLLFASYLALGRQFFPLIYKFEPEIEQWLSSQFQTTVTIGSVEGNWARFGPRVTLTDITIGDELTIEEMVLAPGIFESLSHGGLSFIQFKLDHFSGQLIQDDQGWQLAGLKSNRTTDRNAFDIDKLLSLLQRQKNIQFTELALSISPLDLPSFDLILNEGRLTGYKGQNNLKTEAEVQYLGLTVPIELQVDTNQYQPDLNKLYFKHGSFDFSPWLNRMTERVAKASGAGEYWLNFSGTEWGSLSSRLKLDQLIIDGKANPLSISSVNAEVFVERGLEGIEIKTAIDSYKINGQVLKNTELVIDKKSDFIQLAWNQLPASIVGSWLSLDDGSGFWPALNLRGNVGKGSLQVGLGESKGFSLAASFSETQIDSYVGIPGVNNLSGQLVVKNRQGQVRLNPTLSTVEFPMLFDHNLTADITSSIVHWQVVDGVGVLLGGEHKATAEDKAQPTLAPLPIDVQWYASIKNSQARALGYENTIGLNMYTEQVNQQWVKYIINNNIVGDSVSNFVNENLQQTMASEVGFSFSNTGNGDSQRAQFDVFANLAQTDMGFLSNWQAVTNASGQISINEKALLLDIDQAQYQSFDIDRGSLNLDFESGQLFVDFSANADASEVLGLFQIGPLNELVSDVIQDWQATGKVHNEVNIGLNLKQAQTVNVTTLSDISEGSLALTDFNLDFDNINGLLQFNTETGLLADNIQLTHAGLPQRIRIGSELSENNTLVSIHAEGETPLAFWGGYFNDPYLTGFEDAVGHNTEILIHDNHVQISTHSDFYGAELNFPTPLNKLATESWPTDIVVDIDEFNWKTINVNTDGFLIGYIELDERNRINKATFAVNQPIEIHEEPGVFIDVSAEQVDGDAWWQALQTIRAVYSSQSGTLEGPSFESLLKRVFLTVTSGQYLGQPWTTAKVQLLRNDDAWIINFDTAEGQGNVLIPHDDSSIFADIEWLNLASEASTLPLREQVDPLADYLPNDVPDMELQIKKLIWNEQDMGDWRAKVVVENNVLVASSISGNMPGATLTGELEWQVKEGDHETKFNGLVETGDVLTVLNEWQYAPVLTSRDGQFKSELYWLGSPAFFDFKRLQGKISLMLTKGAILKVEEYEGIKLIGLLNFTRVLQRIALDFSDLLGSGISFDTIEGELLFDRGFARVGEQLVIDGASTNFRFSGDADLLSNVIDIDMVLTVPLSSTFPLVALLAGVSPQAAAAIYVTERVFNNELKKISSARMHITGSFEEPIIKFYRVFDNQIGSEGQTVKDRIKNVVPETANP
ncbi:MAG: hypothetical protein ACI9E9_000883 [Reinekea sp.]|jgi:uncharacterized protein (TIGR02099 family)|uniref:YhdP family phospholipid transporter n=3 Tax=Reinekea sp. TaxID=1970455 RepID=UPI003989A76A